jgi:hypothetical protein
MLTVNFGMGEQQPPTPANQPRFTNRSRTVAVTFTQQSVVIETTEHEHFGRLVDLVALTIAARQEVSPVDGLERLAWRTIARLVGVSVPAVQKWRKGEKMAPENLDKVATLLATCDLVASYSISDVAAWFEIPILPGTPLRPLDLYLADRDELLLDWASHHLIDPVQVLDQFDPNWRASYHSDFEVFEATDGELALRRKA